jgi:pyruvate dehydrogenase E2 component (dihydrolipoamide acetyltransferase)
MPDFTLPDLGEGLEEAEIVAWRVQVGDRVEVDQVIVEVETAKAAVEVPVPYAGFVAELHAAPGDVVAVGRALITVTADEAGPLFREPGIVMPSAPAPSGADDGLDGGSGNVLVGYGTTAAARRNRRGSRRTVARMPVRGLAASTAPGPRRSGPVPVISPLVRKMARDADLDLNVIVGTGPSGLVRREDVHRALARRDAAPMPATPAPLSAPGGAPLAGTPLAGIPLAGTPLAGTRIPLRGPRRAMADNLMRSRREIPEATVWVDVDATEFLAARRAINAKATEQPVSLLALLTRFALLGLRRYPELNARVEPDEIVIPGYVHLGFAAQTDRGLLVPVVRDAHLLSTRELSAALAARTAAARAGSLRPADLTGGTFTVNNYGVFGVDGSAAIINYPEVAILGMGRIIDRPWVVDGQLAVRKVTQLTLAFDHRACDGGTAGGFLRFVADCIESPVAVLSEL